MLRATRVGFLGLLCFGVTSAALAQMAAKLQTSDTELSLEASPNAPRMASFSVSGKPKWENRASETLIDFVEIAGQRKPRSLRCSVLGEKPECPHPAADGWIRHRRSLVKLRFDCTRT